MGLARGCTDRITTSAAQMTGSSTSGKFRFQKAKLFNLERLEIWGGGFSTDLVFLNCCRWGASGAFKKVKSLWPTLKYLRCLVRAIPSAADVTQQLSEIPLAASGRILPHARGAIGPTMSYARSLMQITYLSSILKAGQQGDRSYIAAFQTDAGVFELFLPGSGYPGEFTKFMPPKLRNQSASQSWVAEWSLAELIAAHMQTVLDTAGADKPLAQELVSALLSGKRYGQEAQPDGQHSCVAVPSHDHQSPGR